MVLCAFLAALRWPSLGFVAVHRGMGSGDARVTAGAALRGSLSGSSASVDGQLCAAPALLALGLACAALASARGRAAGAVALQATRTQWYRKVKRISNDRALFDVVVPKPMGVKLERIPDFKKGGFAGVGISEVVAGGSADELNKRVCITEEDSGMWVLEGDRVIAINGEDTKDASIEDCVKIVMDSDNDAVTLTLCRNTRKGPIKVIIMPGGEQATVRRSSRLSAAAEYAAGQELKYGCIDGWCGTCWHRERTTDGIFKPCCDVLTGDWDNVMPLVLTPKPERAGDSTMLKPRGVSDND